MKKKNQEIQYAPCYFGYLFRVYYDEARHEMESLPTSWLVDEFQQNLHSKSDYASALEHILMVCPELDQYMTDYQLVLTGDYPTWKCNKKLVAEVFLVYVNLTFYCPEFYILFS